MESLKYQDATLFPPWMLNSQSWSKNKIVQSGNVMSDILKIPANIRTPEQMNSCIRWLMSRWKIAETMGVKRCASMFKEFKYHVTQPGECIIKEGDRGLTFYIIVSGEASVLKDGLGVVGLMHGGNSFGEVALTMGQDLRTATVVSVGTCELLSLHKNDYDYYVRDLQMVEKKENFHLLTSCELFKSWPKAKVDRMSNTVKRMVYEPGEYVFRQGDNPEALYVVYEGEVNIIKEIVVFCKNKWPTSINEWAERHSTVRKPMSLRHIHKGEFFGEIGILQKCLRTSSARVSTRTVLLAIDKREFLHLVSYGGASVYNTCESDTLMGVVESVSRSYIGDREIMDVYGENSHIKGGPNSIATVGDFKMKKSTLEKHIYEKKLRSYNFVKPKKGKVVTKKEMAETRNKIQENLEKLTREEQMTKKMKSITSEGIEAERLLKEKHEAITSGSAKGRLSSKDSKVLLCSQSLSFVGSGTIAKAPDYIVSIQNVLLFSL
jgi:CRP-like cAMP-binding protein